MQQSDVLLYLVENGPGRSELELSEAIYGAPGYPQRLQQDLLRLVSSGGLCAEVNLIVMREIGESFENAEQLFVSMGLAGSSHSRRGTAS